MKFEFRPYQRPLHPLQTSHGTWSTREGIILRLSASTGQVGYGEIAPIPWFGSETLAAALNFCHQLPDQITSATIATIPANLPACQFGFESALENLAGPATSLPAIAQSLLLPGGNAALDAWKPFWEKGYRTFKWKIGVVELQTELEILATLTHSLPQGAKLRLDANGGLTQQQTIAWLEACRAFPIEFLEQPLPPDQFSTMLELTHHYPTPLALDESITNLEQLWACYNQGWRGIFVIKPAILGSPHQLQTFCQAHPIDIVFSSALETAIGRQAGLRLAAKLGNPDRAVGYGTNHWFQDSTIEDFDQLWQSL